MKTVWLSALTLLMLTACERHMPEGPPLMSRAEFMSKCRVGKDYVDCGQAVGTPDKTQGGSSSTEYWYFARRTFDPATGKTDAMAQVIIERGWVTAINFY